MNLDECRLCRADGVFRWFHVRAIPRAGGREGRIVRWYCLHTDIDEAAKQAGKPAAVLLDVTNQVRLKFADRRSPSRHFGERPAGRLQCDVVYVLACPVRM